MTNVPQSNGDGDVLNYGVELGVRQILAHYIERDEWDLPPAVYYVTHSPSLSGDELPPETLAKMPADMRDAIDSGHARFAGLYLSFAQMPIPERLWGIAPPDELLHALAHALDEHGDDAPIGVLPSGTRLLGVLFAGEAWGLARETPDVDKIAPGDVSTHPDRMECRIVIGVDTAGFAYIGEQIRGEDEPKVDTANVDDIGGKMPHILRELLEALAEDLDAETIG